MYIIGNPLRDCKDRNLVLTLPANKDEMTIVVSFNLRKNKHLVSLWQEVVFQLGARHLLKCWAPTLPQKLEDRGTISPDVYISGRWFSDLWEGHSWIMKGLMKGLFSKEFICISKRGESTYNFKFSKVNALRKRRGEKSLSLFSIGRIKTLIFNFYSSLYNTTNYLLIYYQAYLGRFQFETIINFCCLQHSCTRLLYEHISGRYIPKNEIDDRRVCICSISVNPARVPKWSIKREFLASLS